MFEDVVKQFLDQLIGGEEPALLLSDDSLDRDISPSPIRQDSEILRVDPAAPER